jgi:putative nucleotidyltransferase with HDIG domain
MLSLKDIDFHSHIESLTRTIELKDIYTAGHSKRVSEITDMICLEMGFSHDHKEYMHIAAHLHDIGKIGIPEGILLKTGRLSRAEYCIMQEHPVIGASIFENLKGFCDMATIIRHHHERYDGGGYPSGLKGEEIPLGSAIIAVADSFDAMTNSRPYRMGMSVNTAVEEIISNSGIQFNPCVVESFISVLERKGDRVLGVIKSGDSQCICMESLIHSAKKYA